MLKTEALKKTEKIAAATYLITGFFDDKEPLKWKLRMLSSRLVSSSLSLKDNVSLKEEKVAQDIQKLLLEMSSLFNVAKHAGLVSDMNHEIFSKELDKFATSIAGDLESVLDPNAPVLTENFFTVPKELPERVPTQAFKDNLLPELSEIRNRVSFERARETSNQTNIAKTDSAPKDKNLRDFGAVAVKKNSRQSIIINLLKRKKEIMIKDVSPLIEGVSEKTIQRELLAMVDQGIIKKEGEKRWSRYSLA